MMKYTSIIPGTLFLLVAWDVHARNVWYSDDDSALQPILSQSRKTRICSELCMSGLGGTPCGDSCFDLIPTNLPIAGQNKDSQSAGGNSSGSGNVYNATTREDSCDVLCKNRLGYPLCSCTYDESQPYATDFVEVCSAFCVNYGYQIGGCQSCKVYAFYMESLTNSSEISGNTTALRPTHHLDYKTWCRQKCKHSNGGAACGCQLLTNLYGCQNCSVYKQYVKSKSSESNSAFDTASLNLGTTLEVGWSTWCREVCSDGNGGAACECDLLP